MKFLRFFILLLTVASCATKKYIDKQGLAKGIKSATEETYVVVDDQKRLVHQKQMIFTRNGRIKYSKTVDASGHLVQETKKKLWFVVEIYPDKEAYYCKTRWKPKQRERISCYTKKRYKQNESVYHYNTDGTIAKIVDHFAPFHKAYFYYTNKERSKIVIRDKNEALIDEVLLYCVTKDEKGNCLKEIRISTKTNRTEETILKLHYH
ncbi:hypothetical protein [Flavobacterium granuli]|nr:hypothetical protein [Flavobacterium granuli]